MEIAKGVRVTDPKKFIDSHVKVLEGQAGKKTYLPYYERLVNYYRLVLR